ncbi:glycoside hydrolase family 130 protein [Pedobacter ginsengisoli]|uniref:glycoside hydrolase family 130 protein n=1 Tax=Pedobacter ginsengisoli TaxID=363852 RepID=UPI00254CF5F8|nr:glycosidase [Pedobacter ginsengisoli]
MDFNTRKTTIKERYERLISQANRPEEFGNGIFERYKYPVLTNEHVPYFWKYDLDPASNPLLLERIGINAAFNAGAIKFNGKYLMMARIEGSDRKSFFAIAESPNGVDRFRFWDKPSIVPHRGNETNLYDMRLVQHEDGWIYGVFCTESRDFSMPEADQSSAIAQCGIIRSKDMLEWERLGDFKTNSPQQRNVVLHPEFVNGKYAFYTRPQDGFIEAGKGGGIAFGLSESIENAEVAIEAVLDRRVYHTIYEAKNGLGPAPIKTEKGWLHMAHGVRNTAAGLRYTLYMFLTDLQDLTKVLHKPSGYFLAPEGEERIGDVSNVVFCNGWIADEDGTVFIYYASSDTRMHVAVSSVDRLLDYVINTPEDGFNSSASVDKICTLVDKNKSFGI